MKHALVICLLALCSGCFNDFAHVPSDYVGCRCTGGKVQFLFNNPDGTRTWYDTEKVCDNQNKMLAKQEEK